MFIMKRYLATLCLATTCTIVLAQSRSELMSREKIQKNKIASVSQWTHKFNKDKVDPKGYVTVVTNYDKNGNEVEIINYKQNGSVSSRHTYKYDNQNRKIEYLQYQDYRQKGIELAFRQVFTYDKNGNKASELGFDGRTTYRIAYSYFPNGKQKEIIRYNAANQVEEKWIYEHNGNNTKISIFKPVGTLSKITERKYDSAGNLLDEKNTSGDGKELARTVFTYNANNLPISKSEYYAGELRASYSYVYDGQNQLIETYLIKPNNTRLLYSSYKYDGQGNIVEEKWYEDNATDYSHRNYKLDSKGIVDEVDTYYSDYNFRVVYRYEYKFF